MESYRHANYRYSTGNGFNPIVDTPMVASDVASFKMEPLLHNQIESETLVNIKREADRVSMQLEDGMRQIKNLGYNEALANNLKTLKKRVELIRHLMTNYPIQKILREDLEEIYVLYVKNSPGIDPIISRVVAYNRNAKELRPYITTAQKVRKGYNIFDQFGRKLDSEDKNIMQDSKEAASKAKEKTALSGFGDTLSGFGNTLTSNPVKTIGIVVILVLVYNLIK